MFICRGWGDGAGDKRKEQTKTRARRGEGRRERGGVEGREAETRLLNAGRRTKAGAARGDKRKQPLGDRGAYVPSWAR